jgi:protein-disulfide isomerase
VSSPFQVLPGRLAVPVTDEDHILGPATAPVTLVEYGDYQCPYCGMAHPIVHELLQRRPDTVRFVYRHFPLANIHPYAEVAAEAAEAAGARRKFWPMHDWLFQHQDRLDLTYLGLAAGQLGLDADAIMQEISEHRYLGRIRRDLVGGARSGVNGTPTFFVNGIRHDGSYALADLLAAVDEAATQA